MQVVLDKFETVGFAERLDRHLGKVGFERKPGKTAGWMDEGLAAAREPDQQGVWREARLEGREITRKRSLEGGEVLFEKRRRTFDSALGELGAAADFESPVLIEQAKTEENEGGGRQQDQQQQDREQSPRQSHRIT
jgi:hypothetical protein